MKFFLKIIQAILVAPAWYYVFLNTDGIVYRGEYFNLITYLGIGFAFMAILYPKKWAMSINSYDDPKTNILEKLSPLVLAGAFIFGLSKLEQTWAIVAIQTFFVSNTLTYIAFLIADLTAGKLFRFFKK